MPTLSQKKKKLTPKRERFCQEYLIDLNGSAAARRAGFAEHAAGQMGYDLLKLPEIQARISELRQVTAQQFNITKEKIMREMLNIVGAKIEDIFDAETGAVLPVHEWPEHMKGVISSIESDELYGKEKIPIGLRRKVRMWEKTKAAEILNKMLGFNAPDKIAATTPDGQAAPAPVINILPVQPKNDDI